jgi:O-antigen/teichoic acid export membrane protein
LRLTAFDTSTELGRSDERYRIAAVTAVASVFSRALAMLVMIMSVKLTIPYLGAERFGIWMTILSLAAVLSFLDLGVGNAIKNKVAHVAAVGTPKELQSTISGGLGFLFVLGCCVGAVMAMLASVLPWDLVIKVNELELYTEVRQVAILFAILFGIQIFTNGINQIFSGLQCAFEVHLVSFIASFASLIALYFVAGEHADIVWLLLVTFGVQVTATLGLLLVLRKRSQFVLSGINHKIKKEAFTLLSMGGVFLILQIGAVIGVGVDSILVSSNLGAEYVAIFSILQRLFQFASQPMNIINAPLWSAYADADARNEREFIRKTLRSSLINTFIFSVVSVCFIFVFGDRLIEAWTNGHVMIGKSLLIIYGCWVIVEMVGNAFGIFLNGCGVARPQVINVITYSFIAIAVKLYAIQAYGLEAMIIGAICVYILVTGLMYGCVFKEHLLEKLG